MASTKLMTTKDGKRFYKISVSRGYGVTPYTMRWYVPEGKSQKTIEKELNKVATEFEIKCANGEIKTRKEVKEEQKKLELEKAKIKTLRQYGDDVFMKEKREKCKVKTIDEYESKLKLHIYPALGEYKIEEIKPAQIRALLLDLTTTLGYASVIKVYAVLNLLFKMAYLDDTIEKNPMDKVERPKALTKDGKDSTVKAFTEEDLVKIIQYADQEPLKWKVYLYLLLDTGCRRGEISGLKWHSIDFKRNTITINNNLCYVQGKVYDDTPKNGKSRVIFVDPKIIKLLEELKRKQTESRKVISLDSYENYDYVFTQADGILPMHPTSVNHYLREFGKKCGIEDFHAHRFRHTWASIAIKNGADIASVSERLGHSDKAVTLNMYTHADEESQKRASEIFRKALGHT